MEEINKQDKLSQAIVIGSLALDFSKAQISINDRPVELTAKELELLKILVRSKGRVLTRDYLLDTIWGFGHAQDIKTRTVDVHIRTLRKKLEDEAKRIITVKNYGYRFNIE